MYLGNKETKGGIRMLKRMVFVLLIMVSTVLFSVESIIPLRVECDDSITEPRTECWCTEVRPAYTDWTCYAQCVAGCATCGTNAVCYAACTAYCLAQCTYPETCVGEYECVTIYPCSWYSLLDTPYETCCHREIDLNLRQSFLM